MFRRERGQRLPPARLPGTTPALNTREQYAIEAYKSLTTTGVEAAKAALLLNGGAAVAFIAFLGNLLANKHDLPNLEHPLICYLAGLISAGFALVLVCLVNLRVYNEDVRQLPARYPWLLRPAIILVVASYLCFIAGSVLASLALEATI